MISATELALLLRGSDRDANLDSLQSLITRGLVTAVIDRDLVVGIRTTSTGGAALRSITLPASKE